MGRFEASEFAHPPAEYRPVPMWFWNGELEEAELLRQVRAMAAGGLGGFQIAARTGLATPYLSGRWFRLIDAVSAEARRQGLDVWLADEYPYPSGAGGGELLLRHPEFRAWHMRSRRLPARPGEHVVAAAPGTVLLHASAVPLCGGSPDWSRAVDLREEVGLVQPEPVFSEPAFGLSGKRTFAFGPTPTLDWCAPGQGAEDWEVWLVAAAEVAPFKFFGYYVDLCNPEAVRAFLDSTYRRYAERLDPATLRHLRGFFLDEAHPPSWSRRLPAAFRERGGEELSPLLPALWTDVGPRTAQIRHDYWQALTELFVASFHRPVAEWCRRHGVQLSLEVDSLRNSVQRHADIGGNDPGHEKVGMPWEPSAEGRARPRFRGHPRFAASLAAQVGQRRVLDEAFHSVGWSMTLQDMKALLDRLAAQGANMFVFHAFFYTVGGLTKWDAPPSQFLQNPYWTHFPRLSAYAGRLCYALSRGRRVAPIALLDPVTSLWTHGGGAANGNLPGMRPDALAERLADDWQYLLRELEAAPCQFDTLDPLLLAEGRVEGGALRLGEAAYRVIVLPPMASLEAAAWAMLEAFAAAGGRVVACGLLPFERIEARSEVPVRCAARFGVDPTLLRRRYEQEAGEGGGADVGEAVGLGGPAGAGRPALAPIPASAMAGSGIVLRHAGAFTLLSTAGSLRQAGVARALLAVLEAFAPPDLVLSPAAGADGRAFLAAQRRDVDSDHYFIANAGDQEVDCTLELRAAGADERDVVLERLDLEDGTRHPLPAALARSGDGSARLRVTLRFPRYGSHLLTVRRGAAPVEPPIPDGGDARAEQARQAAERSGVPDGDAADAATLELPLDQPWRGELAGDNALRLERFRFGVLPDPEALPSPVADAPPPDPGPDAPLIEPKPLINLLGELEAAGRPLPLRLETPFGSPARLGLHLPLGLCYFADFTVAALPSRAVLCRESPALLGEWAIWLNDVPVPAEAFAPRFRWDVTNREADVRPLLRLGRNTLTVRVEARHPTDGLVDALYLLGDFGVSSAAPDLPVLGELPREVRWRHLPEDGLPYYGGVLHLETILDLPAGPPVPATLALPDDLLMYLGVAELALNGRDLGVRLWAPYRWPAPAGLLRAGANEVRATLTTTLVGLLEGKRYDPTRRVAVRVAG